MNLMLERQRPARSLEAGASEDELGKNQDCQTDLTVWSSWVVSFGWFTKPFA